MRRQTAVALVGVVVLAVVSCGRGSQTDRTEVGPRPVIVDTDGGSDDAMALLYLLQEPTVEVVAVTVSGTGIVHCGPGIDNVAGLIDMAAPQSDIPIACGTSGPLDGDRTFPFPWRQQADDRYGGILPDGDAPGDDRTAAELIIDAVERADAPPTILTLGPLTNLALALRNRPSLDGQIRDVVIMGGALEVDGNVSRADGVVLPAEWNLYVDPTAAREVVASSAPVTVVPLDSQVPVDAYVVRSLARTASTPPATTIAALLRSSAFFTSGQFFLWDPLAAAAVAQPDLFDFTTRELDVVTDGPDAGRTVVGRGTAVSVASVRDRDEFTSTYLGRLDGRAEAVAVDRTPDISASTIDCCTVTPTRVPPGPTAVELATADLVVALGKLDGQHSDAEIEAYLAGSPDEPPPWFELAALIQAQGPSRVVLVDLPTGDLTAICLVVEADVAVVSGRSPLTVAG